MTNNIFHNDNNKPAFCRKLGCCCVLLQFAIKIAVPAILLFANQCPGTPCQQVRLACTAQGRPAPGASTAHTQRALKQPSLASGIGDEGSGLGVRNGDGDGNLKDWERGLGLLGVLDGSPRSKLSRQPLQPR